MEDEVHQNDSVDHNEQTQGESQELTQEQQEQLKRVDPKAYEEVKRDMMKYKTQYRSIQEEKQALENKIKEIERNQLEGQQKYKELYEMSKQEAEEYKSEAEKVRQAYIEDYKFRAIEQKAVSAGLDTSDPDVFEFLRFKASKSDQVLVESTSEGRINVLGVDEFVDELKMRNKSLFKGQRAPNVNLNAPDSNVDNRPMTGSELLKLQKENPELYRKRVEQMIKRRV